MLIHIWILGNKISENLIIHEVICSDRALIAASGFRVEFLKETLLVLNILVQRMNVCVCLSFLKGEHINCLLKIRT